MDSKSRAWHDDEISLRDLIDVIRRARWLILIVAPLCAILTLVIALAMPKEYAASVTVSPVTDNGSMARVGGLASIASQFSGLASLAGISLPSDSKKAETLAVLQSQALTEQYIEDNKLLPVLFPDLWDPARQTWRTTDPTKVPTLWKANQYFAKHVRSLATDSKTGLVTLTITWRDPRKAAQWANGLVKLTNEYLRTKAIAESQRDIDYLTEEATKTELVGVRQAIYTLMQNQIDNVMLAKGNDEYALKVLDPAQTPERPSSPRPVVWTVVGFCVGAVVAFVIALMRIPAATRRLAPTSLKPEPSTSR